MKDITYKLQISVNGRQEFTISTVDYDLLYQEMTNFYIKELI